MAPRRRHPTDGGALNEGRKIPDAGSATAFSRVAALAILLVLFTPLVAAAGVALTYSTYYGGSGADSGKAIAVDGAGNIYVAVGGPGTGTPGKIVTYGPDGQSILYTAPLGDMAPVALAVDSAGNAYVAATCPHPRSGLTFDCPTLNSLASGRPQAQGDSGGYVLKLGPTGTLLFSTSLGGVGSVAVGGIAVDPAGNIYVTGSNAYGGFPTTRPAFAKPGVTSGSPAFVAAIAADMSRFIYFVEFLLGADPFQPTALAVDRTGAAYVFGVAGAQFPTTPGAFQPTTGSGTSAPALAKIAPDASALVYATYFGGSGMFASGVAVDADGNAYITGGAAAGLPTVKALQPAFAGGATDAFVARFDATGSSLVFSTYLGGSGDDEAAGIALDSSANVYVAGVARSSNFPQVNPLPSQQGAPGSNFVAQLTSDGQSLVYSTYFADSQTYIGDVAASATGTAYVTGTTFSPTYPTVRPSQATYGGGSGDAFVAKLEPSSIRVFVTSPAEGSTVSGTVWTDVWAENYVGTSNTFTLSTGDTVLATGTANNHATLAWDSSKVADGPQTLTATVRDSAGHVGTGTRAFVVKNGTTSTLTAAFTSPAANATVSGTVSVGMTETGASGTPITFTLTVDGAQVFAAAGTATTATFAWNTTTVADGAHTLGLTVRDGAGRTATATRGVTVSNNGGGTGTLNVFITSPAAGATVTGTVWSDVWVERASAGTRTFTLAIGGVTLMSGTDASNHVTLPWDSTRVANGTQTLVATVRDASGNSGSTTRAFNVQNAGGGGGPAPLTASFTAPADGATVSGTVSVGMSETGARGTPIFFTLTVDGGQVFGTSGSATSASFAWNTTSIADGAHTLGLTVQDGAGRTATATRGVTVKNTTPPPPPPGPISVFITQPRNGDTVRGVVWFTIWVDGAASGSKTYTLTEGGRTLATTTTTSSGPVSIPWPTTTGDNGPRTPTVGVRDSTGATGTGSVNVTVAN